MALVGQTGSGKTRWSSCSIGFMTWAAAPCWSTASMCGLVVGRAAPQVSIIEQDLFLFSRTIAENIDFGRPGATQEAIEEAARAAQAHDFIIDFADGYKTVSASAA